MYDRLRSEWRLMGKKAFFPQVVLLAAGWLFAIVLGYTNGPTARFLSAVLEMLLPLVTGVSVALLTSSDPALELQLAFPYNYALTVCLRIVSLVIWNGVLSLLTSCIIFALGLAYLPLPQPPTALGTFLAGQLAWFPSLLICTAFGFGAALLLQSRAGSAGLLAALWIIEIVFKNVLIQTIWLYPFVWFPTTLFPGVLPFSLWLANRWLVLAVALVLLLASWPLLLLPERLLKGSHHA